MTTAPLNQLQNHATANSFAKAAAPAVSLFNGEKPYVLMYVAGEKNLTRGDVNGYTAIATRVANKLGADFKMVGHDDLATMYPREPGYDVRFMKFLEEKGMPDVLFTHRYLTQDIEEYIEAKGTGVIVESVNEFLRDNLCAGNSRNSAPKDIVPHNLTAEDLAYEGRRFAEEYQELPRPFIAINLLPIDTDAAQKLATVLGRLKHVYDSATFFICSTHRTNGHTISDVVMPLQTKLGNAAERFPVITFDYLLHAEHLHGMDATWNPYKGLLDQADHVIIAGSSASILTETIYAGKTAYCWEEDGTNRSLARKGWVNFLKLFKKGQPLVTDKLALQGDAAEDCADVIVKKHERHVSAIKNASQPLPDGAPRYKTL